MDSKDVFSASVYDGDANIMQKSEVVAKTGERKRFRQLKREETG